MRFFRIDNDNLSPEGFDPLVAVRNEINIEYLVYQWIPVSKTSPTKILLFVFGLSFFLFKSSYSQTINGVYHGSLVTEKNLLYIEETDGGPFIKIFFSEKESIQVFGEFSDGKLTFSLPQNEGKDLIITAELNNDPTHLNIEFELDGNTYKTVFEKIESPKRNLEKTWFDKPTDTSFDPKITGKWIHYLTTDNTGEALKDHILTKKPYVTEFSEKGIVLYDLQLIRDVFKESGYTNSLDYTKIPKATWFTSENNSLTITVDGVSLTYLYEASSDSLKLFTNTGYTQYYVRK